MVTVLLTMPEPLAAEVAGVARRRGRSALIREAIETSLKAGGVKHPRSALDLVRDLAGTLEGPEDLSVNRKYLEGFGE